MNELERKLKELRAKYRRLTDEARGMLAEEAPDLAAIKSFNDDIEQVKAQMTEMERTLAALREQDVEREAEAKAAEEARQAEIQRLADEKAKTMVKNLGLDRPDYTRSKTKKDEPEMPAHMQRIQVSSVYDEMGTLDLAVQFYIKSRAAKIGAGRTPSDQMGRALIARAAQFVRETDRVPRFDRYGEVKLVEMPAFNPREFQNEMAWRDEQDTWNVGGKEIGHSDNVTPEGIKSLWELGLKANELVYSTYTGYGEQLGNSCVMA